MDATGVAALGGQAAVNVNAERRAIVSCSHETPLVRGNVIGREDGHGGRDRTVGADVKINFALVGGTQVKRIFANGGQHRRTGAIGFCKDRLPFG